MSRTASAGWSRYWAAGHAHSCPTSFPGYYGPNIQSFWQRQLAACQPGETLLELGCGNGGLLKFLAEQSAVEALPTLLGIDFAQLKPTQLQTLMLPAAKQQRISIRGDVRFEALPFADSSVDAVVSQFAVEYAQGDSVWQEMLRVLKPQARIALLIHKSGSRLDAVASDEIDIAERLLAVGGVFDQARHMIPLVARAATSAGRQALATDNSALKHREAFNQASQQLQQAAAQCQFGGYALEILDTIAHRVFNAAAISSQSAITQLADIRMATEEHLERIRALHASAFCEDQVRTLCARFEGAGFAMIEPHVIAEQGHEMAWALSGVKG